MSENKIILTEDTLTDKIFNEIHSCDGDLLAAIAGLMFGGECLAIDDHYEFFPNENYFDAFGELTYTVSDGPSDNPVVLFTGNFDAAKNHLYKIIGAYDCHNDIVQACRRLKYNLSFGVEK